MQNRKISKLKQGETSKYSYIYIEKNNTYFMVISNEYEKHIVNEDSLDGLRKSLEEIDRDIISQVM